MGKRTLIKSGLCWWLAAAVSLSPLAHAQTPTAPVEILKATVLGPEGPTGLTFTIQPVEAGGEAAALEDAVNQDSFATVTYFHSGPIDAIHPSILKLQDRVVQLETIQIQREKSEPFAIPAKSGKPSKVKSLLLTVRAAGSYTAAYYLFGYLSGNDTASGLEMFGLATIISGYQIMFTDSWQKFLRGSGKVARSAWSAVAKVMGRTVQEGRVSDQTGRILGAYGFNALTTATILGVLGALDSATQVASLAAIASWDTLLDVTLGRQVERGRVAAQHYEKFVTYRLTYGPWLEGPAVTLGGTVIGATAGAALGAVAAAGIVTAYTLEPLQDVLEKRRLSRVANDDAARAPVPSRWEWFKSKLKRKPAAKASVCDQLLQQGLP